MALNPNNISSLQRSCWCKASAKCNIFQIIAQLLGSAIIILNVGVVFTDTGPVK